MYTKMFLVCIFHFNITWYASLTLSLTSIPPQGHLVQPHTLHVQNLRWEKRWLGVQDCGNHGREFELQVYLTVWVTLFSNGKNGETGWTFSPLQMESSGEKTLTDPSMAWLVNFHQNHILYSDIHDSISRLECYKEATLTSVGQTSTSSLTEPGCLS